MALTESHQLESSLIERLIAWAQNEEMINAEYTIHGKDCREVAALLHQIDDLWIALYGGERCTNAMCYAKRFGAIVDDLRCQTANFKATDKERIRLDDLVRGLTPQCLSPNSHAPGCNCGRWPT